MELQNRLIVQLQAVQEKVPSLVAHPPQTMEEFFEGIEEEMPLSIQTIDPKLASDEKGMAAGPRHQLKGGTEKTREL